MDITRCVTVATESVQVCQPLIAYLRKRKDKYNWILKTRFGEGNCCFFLWWSKDTEFSDTPLRSFLKRIGNKEVLASKSFGKRIFTISRKKRSYDIVTELPSGFLTSSESNICEDLATLLMRAIQEGVDVPDTKGNILPVEEMNVSKPESVEIVKEEQSTDEKIVLRELSTDGKIDLIMKAVIHLIKKVEQLPKESGLHDPQQ